MPSSERLFVHHVKGLIVTFLAAGVVRTVLLWAQASDELVSLGIISTAGFCGMKSRTWFPRSSK